MVLPLTESLLKSREDEITQVVPLSLHISKCGADEDWTRSPLGHACLGHNDRRLKTNPLQLGPEAAGSHADFRARLRAARSRQAPRRSARPWHAQEKRENTRGDAYGGVHFLAPNLKARERAQAERRVGLEPRC